MEVPTVKKVGALTSYFGLLAIIVIATSGSTSSEYHGITPQRFLLEIFFVVFGYPCLLCGYQRSAYTSMGFSLLAISFAFILMYAFLSHFDSNFDSDYYDALELSVFCVIFYGVISGRVSIVQMTVLVFLGVIIQLLVSRYLFHVLPMYSPTAPLTEHLGAGLFGFGVAVGLRLVNRKPEREEPVTVNNKTVHYGSRVISFLGLFVLYAIFPLHNAYIEKTPLYASLILPTYVALFGSTFIVFVMSGILNNWFLDPFHIIQQSLSGAVAISGCVADIDNIAFAAFIGIIAGFFSILSSRFFTPLLTRKFGLVDTRDVMSLHTIPGFIGSIAGAIYAGHVDDSSAGTYLLTILAYMVLISLTGFVSGCIVARFDRLTRDEQYDDNAHWVVPPNMRTVEQHKVRTRLNLDVHASEESSGNIIGGIVSSTEPSTTQGPVVSSGSDSTSASSAS